MGDACGLARTPLDAVASGTICLNITDSGRGSGMLNVLNAARSGMAYAALARGEAMSPIKGA